jgi:hypothetical protein
VVYGYALAGLLLCTWTAIGVPTARADATADAEALLTRGIELRRQGDDAGALELFKQAAEAHSTPRAVAQMGLAEQALGRWVEAEEHLKLALDDANNPWVGRNRETLTRSLAAVSEHIGSIELSCDVAGASVSMNGVLAGRTPLSGPLRAAAGSVVFEIVADGFHPMTRSLQVSAGGLARENVTLVPMRVALPPPVVAPVVAPVVTPPPTEPVAPPPVPETIERPPAVDQRSRTHTRITIRENSATQQQQPRPAPPPPAPEPVVVDDETAVAEGAEISLYVGYGGFFRRDAGLFLTTNDRGPHALNLGGVGQFSVGYRPIRWVSFGAQVIGSLQEGTATYWDQQGGEKASGRLLSLSTGAYVRGHLVGTLFGGAFDLWLGTGFHPFSRVWVNTAELPNYQINAMAMPLELGIALFGSKSFAIELKASMLRWFPLDYCVISAANRVCGGSVQSQTSWDTALGFTWVL